MPSKKLLSLTRTTTSSSPHLRCFVTQSVTHNKNDSHMYLRRTGSTQKCIIVVPDRKAADYIAKILGKDESCISEPAFKVKSVNSSPKASKKPMFQRGFMMSAQEKMWFKTWRGRRSTKLDPYTDEDRVIVQDALRTYRVERVADSYYKEPEWTPDA